MIESSPAVDPTRDVNRFRKAWAVTLALLIGATWPLWTPLRGVPRVSPVGVLAGAPHGGDFVLLALLAVGLWRSAACVTHRGTVLATGALAVLMAVDQLRWQPWAYHALLAGLLMSVASERVALNGLRAIAVSVYAYSALAKLDATYAASLGQELLTTLGGAIGLSVGEWSPPARTVGLLAPPGVELLLAATLAVSLWWRPLARPAVAAAAAMHLMTIGALGPWGMNHSWGVLLWNAGFAWQTAVLFWPNETGLLRPKSRGDRVAVAVTLLAIAMPATAGWGVWDRWPSWGLYAPAGERASVWIHRAAIDRLPESLRPYAVEDEENSPWTRLRLDRWVLDQTLAPIYPQNRVRGAMAIGVARRYGLSDRVRVIAEGRADRWSGERESQTLTGAEAIEPIAGGSVVSWSR